MVVRSGFRVELPSDVFRKEEIKQYHKKIHPAVVEKRITPKCVQHRDRLTLRLVNELVSEGATCCCDFSRLSLLRVALTERRERQAPVEKGAMVKRCTVALRPESAG